MSHLVVASLLTAAVTAYYHSDDDTKRFALGFVVFGAVFFALTFRTEIDGIYSDNMIPMFWPVSYRSPKSISNMLGRPQVITHVVTLALASLGGFVIRYSQRSSKSTKDNFGVQE